MTNKFITVIFLFSFLSCSKIGTLNLQRHQYGESAENVVWMQIPGLTDEHIALLKFGFNDFLQKSSLERIACIGKSWNYNLYNLRPTPESDFLAQVTGKNNIKNLCSDFKLTPIWDYLYRDGYSTGVFEVGSSLTQSFENSKHCDDNKFLEKVILWKMSKRTNSKNTELFHFQENWPILDKKIYYDKSCQQGECYSTPIKNINSIYKEFRKKFTKSLFIYRDFSFYNALIKRDIRLAREKLIEIEKIFDFFYEWQRKNRGTLLLLTSSSAQEVEFPSMGKNWGKFEMKGKFLNFKKAKLISSVYAIGSGAEKFCGFYNASDILSRILWDPDENKSLLERLLPIQ